MMLLKIVDKPGTAAQKDTIEVSLDAGADSHHFVTDAPQAGAAGPGTELAATLDWYFAEYPRTAAEGSHDRGIAQALPEIGQRLGSFGDQGKRLAEILEKRDLAQLDVRIESSRAAFLAAPWELLTLSGGQPLSTEAASFVRRFTGEGVSEDDRELVFDLKVTAPVPDAVAALNAQLGTPPPAEKDTRHDPLRVLHVVAPGPLDSNAAVEWATQSLEAEGAIDYELFAGGSWPRLRERLEDRKSPVHVVHYDGPVLLDAEGRASAALEENVSFDDFAKALARGKVAALCIDARGYLQGTEPVAAATGLSAVARSARRAGLGNVIGTSHTTDPWTSGRCFQSIYHRLTSGAPMVRAVVEARKALLAQTDTSLFTSEALPFHAWPLPVHYGGQRAVFFETEQTRANLPESQTLVRARQRLLGFDGLMLPPLVRSSSDGQAVALIGEIERSRRALSLTGEPGAGKTFLTHRVAFHLAARSAVEFAFYFDYAADFYSVGNILEMIAPILGLTVDQKDEARAALRKRKCLFVLDNLSAEKSTEPSTEAAWAALLELLGEFSSSGHIVLCTGRTPRTDLPPAFAQIALRGLTTSERRHLGAARLRASQLPAKDREGDFESLLDATRGNPFLLERALPLLDQLAPGDLARTIEARIPRDASPVDAFYDWQWSEIPRHWRGLLLLCAETEGLLLELIMVAADQKEPFPPAKELLAAMGGSNAIVADGLKLWERSGVIDRLPHGRGIASQARPFLDRKRGEPSSDLDEAARLRFSQTLCEGIRLLSQHLRGQRNPAISHYLLVNRRRWVPHFERLWFAGDYRGFLGSKNAFDHLLHQAQIGEESAVWALNLLQRTPEPRGDADANPEAQLAWLALATTALTSAGAENDEAMKKGAAVWQRWFETRPDTMEKRETLVFQRAAMFLDLFHRNSKDWKAAIAINEKARPIYTRAEAWPLAIQTLKALSRYHVEIGAAEQALTFEEAILHEIPYANAPPGFQAQQWFDVATARATRGAFPAARTVVDQLLAMDDAKRLGDALEGLNAEIHFQQGNYGDAIRYHCKLWARALQSEQRPLVERLQARFQEFQSKLGRAEVERHLEAELPAGTARPKLDSAAARTN